MNWLSCSYREEHNGHVARPHCVVRDFILRSSYQPSITWFSTDKYENHVVKIKGHASRTTHADVAHATTTQNETLAADLQLKCETIAYHMVERVCVFYEIMYLERTIHSMPRGWSHEKEMKKVRTSSQSIRSRSNVGTPEISPFISFCLRSKYAARKWKADDQTGPTWSSKLKLTCL